MDPRQTQTWRFEMADNDVTRIAGNIGAMNALNALTTINKNLSTYQSRLASGKRINSAADDPAGLTIATKMQARSEGLKQALSNIGDAKNLLAVAESGLGRINDILIQMRNKAEAGASDTMGTNERQALVDQMVAYSKQVDDIVAQTKWTSDVGGQSLIGGYYNGNALTFQTGVDQGQTTTLNGLVNVAASGTGSLLLAAQSTGTQAASYTGNAAVSATGTSATFNAQITSGELATGTYDIKIDTTVATAAQVSIYQHGSTTALMIDADGSAATTAIDNKLTVDMSAVHANLNLGNGLTLSLGTAANSATPLTGTVSYTSGASQYQLKLSDNTTLTSASGASAFSQYMTDINSKLTTVSGQLSQIGALTGRLTFKEDQISAAQINTESAYNRIMNANMAEEQVNASKYLILQQTATAMLSQANTAPQFLLSLFK
jgi:flagellin